MPIWVKSPTLMSLFIVGQRLLLPTVIALTARRASTGPCVTDLALDVGLVESLELLDLAKLCHAKSPPSR